ncbi:Uncharacterised protein [Mycobacteroides abscessus subsp. massiliense]|nr:Uncharacterised protein [Mycobacteroides abscessus subsp. massiliense]SKK34355.1 Uncharacterised protein [Mycobacteroides abscessus subsp. massiliense]SKK53524.1 Uncharacterised protein [Mycobacteroides abscessus subsp. massiliense]
MAVCGSLGAIVAAEVPTTAAPYIAGAAFGVLLWASTTRRTDSPEHAAVPMGRALAVSPGERLTATEVVGRARHEAGHAVLAYHHGIGLAEGFVSSSPSTQVGGQIRYAERQRVTTWHDEWVRIQLAWGGEAVQRVDGHRLTSPSTYDAAAAHRSAEHLHRIHADLGFAYESGHELSGKALDAAVDVVRRQPAAVDAVAALLVAHADQCVDGQLICAAIGAVWLPNSEGPNE